MSSTEKLLDIADALDEADLPFLIMGGHAVRYYGLERNTVDFDFHVSLPAGVTLLERLEGTVLFRGRMLRPEIAWRGDDFQRFQIGVLPSGKEEWLEFWIRNHLLPPFDTLFARREEGLVLRRKLPFLSLADLIRSKETERDDDWRDVSYLEEVQDERNLRTANDSPGKLRFFSGLRSRRGFENALLAGLLNDVPSIESALQLSSHPISTAWLFPYASREVRSAAARVLDRNVAAALDRVVPASPRHLALVEATRIAYQRLAKEADRRDKEHFRTRP